MAIPFAYERTVAARLIRAVGNLDWPLEQLEIQVLDDSTDETCGVADRVVMGILHVTPVTIPSLSQRAPYLWSYWPWFCAGKVGNMRLPTGSIVRRIHAPKPREQPACLNS